METITGVNDEIYDKYHNNSSLMQIHFLLRKFENEQFIKKIFTRFINCFKKSEWGEAGGEGVLLL